MICFRLYTDDSAQEVGAALYVVRYDKELPISFNSRQLLGAEKRYSATELEGFAIYLAIHTFAPLLYGKQFAVRTDHRALVSLLKSRVFNNLLYRWVLKLQSMPSLSSTIRGKRTLDRSWWQCTC